MTLQQLEYVVALDNHRRFSIAAEECHVAQPSLSAALQKLEDELGVKLFDRSKQPVVPTELGVPFIQQARRVLRETEALRLMVSDHCETQSGEFSLGIIPTLAPYLLPLFLKDFSEKFPEIKLHLHERTTENLLALLKREQLDAILLATPAEEGTFVKDCLFYEEFVAYAPHEASILEKRFLLTEDIDPNRIQVTYTDGTNQTEIARVLNEGLCDPVAGGYYTNDLENPTQVLLCPASCGQVVGEVSITFVCVKGGE
jgi:LysR family hydrogen peroxide-inducible transcriptional activator